MPLQDDEQVLALAAVTSRVSLWRDRGTAAWMSRTACPAADRVTLGLRGASILLQDVGAPTKAPSSSTWPDRHPAGVEPAEEPRTSTDLGCDLPDAMMRT
jgi:hypothetical protein